MEVDFARIATLPSMVAEVVVPKAGWSSPVLH